MKIFREKHECAVSSPHGRRAGGLHGLHLDPQEKGIDGNPQKVWYISPEVKGHMLMEEMTERQQHALPALPECVRKLYAEENCASGILRLALKNAWREE